LEGLIEMPKNDGKQWTTQDKRELKTLARDTNVSTDRIATKLGRTVPAVRAQAQRQNTSLKPKNK
jgi:IS30 family transposase